MGGGFILPDTGGPRSTGDVLGASGGSVNVIVLIIIMIIWSKLGYLSRVPQGRKKLIERRRSNYSKRKGNDLSVMKLN